MSDKGFGLSVEGEYMECLTLFQVLGIFPSSRNKVCKEYEVVSGIYVQVLLGCHRYDRCHPYIRRED